MSFVTPLPLVRCIGNYCGQRRTGRCGFGGPIASTCRCPPCASLPTRTSPAAPPARFRRFLADYRALLSKSLTSVERTRLLNTAGALFLLLIIASNVLNAVKDYRQRLLNVRVMLTLRRARSCARRSAPARARAPRHHRPRRSRGSTSRRPWWRQRDAFQCPRSTGRLHCRRHSRA